MITEESPPAPGLPFEVDIRIDADMWRQALPADPGGFLAAIARATVAGADLEAVPGSELGVVFSDDETVCELNGQYRGKNTPTNVLSFPVDDGNGGPPGPLIGDIILAHETILRESHDLGLPFTDHLTHLIVHGLLHLFGYDHETDEDAVEMESLETEILAALELADPYMRTE